MAAVPLAGQIFSPAHAAVTAKFDHQRTIDWVLFLKQSTASSFAQGSVLPPESGIITRAHSAGP
jgi:hypothetical protein